MHYRLSNMAHRKLLTTLPKESPIRTPKELPSEILTKLLLRTPTMAHHKIPTRLTYQKNNQTTDSHHSSHRTPSRLSTGPLNSAQTPVTVHHRPPTRLPKDPTITKRTNLYRQPSPGTPYSPSLDSPRTPSRSPPATREPTPPYGVRGGCKGAHNYFRF